MNDDTARLAAEIRQHIDNGHWERSHGKTLFRRTNQWHYDFAWDNNGDPISSPGEAISDSGGELPEALAADLIAAGWRPPQGGKFDPDPLPVDDPEAMRALGWEPVGPAQFRNWKRKS